MYIVLLCNLSEGTDCGVCFQTKDSRRAHYKSKYLLAAKWYSFYKHSLEIIQERENCTVGMKLLRILMCVLRFKWKAYELMARW